MTRIIVNDRAPRQPWTGPEGGPTGTLIEASTPKRFNFARYKDLFKERLAKLIETKVAGQEIVAPPPQENATSST